MSPKHESAKTKGSETERSEIDDTAAPRSGRRRRRLLTTLLAIVVLAVIAGVTILAVSADSPDGRDESSIPQTTFPAPPGSAQIIDESADATGGEKTTFTSDLLPTVAIDEYLQKFAIIGWTTLTKEGDDVRSVLKMQGGNRYATIVISRADVVSNGTVCQGTDRNTVDTCALGG